MTETLTADQIKAIEAEFHGELLKISYDLSGSMMDQVEYCLRSALKNFIQDQED